MFGIVYQYRDNRTGEAAYVGKAVAPYSIEQACRSVQARHLTIKRAVPFNALLRQDPERYTFAVLAEVTAPTSSEVNGFLHVIEKHSVHVLNPRHNVVKFNSKSGIYGRQTEEPKRPSYIILSKIS